LVTERYEYFKAVAVGTGDDRHLVVKGEIDLHTAVLLSKHIARLVEDGADPVVVDMAEITFLDSSGIEALVRAQDAMGQRPEALVLRRPSPIVRRVLAMAGVEALFTIREA
jgi:anti-anti-sigma factor